MARHFKAAAQAWLEEPQGWPWPKLGDVQKMLGLPKSRIVAGLRCVFFLIIVFLVVLLTDLKVGLH